MNQSKLTSIAEEFGSSATFREIDTDVVAVLSGDDVTCTVSLISLTSACLKTGLKSGALITVTLSAGTPPFCK